MTELAIKILDILKTKGTTDFDSVADELGISHEDFLLAISELSVERKIGVDSTRELIRLIEDLPKRTTRKQCPYCDSTDVETRGTSSGVGVMRRDGTLPPVRNHGYRCISCERTFRYIGD